MQRKIITDGAKNVFYVVEYDAKYPLDYHVLGTFQDRQKAKDFLEKELA